jgi:hypothetical protein
VDPDGQTITLRTHVRSRARAPTVSAGSGTIRDVVAVGALPVEPILILLALALAFAYWMDRRR